MSTIDSGQPRRKRKGIFYGWWIVIAAATMHFFGGGTFYYGFTVFFNPIRETFGWSAAVTSVAFTLQRLEQGILGPVAGFFVDRLGPRKLMFGGWAIVGLGFLLMSRINSLWAFYGTFVVVAVGMSFASGLASNTAIANWFTKKRSRALTIAFLGPGLSGLLVPLLASFIGQFGWRETLIIAGITLWVVGLPLSLVMRHKASQYGRLPDGEAEEIGDDLTKASARRASGRNIQTVSDMPTANFTTKEVLKMPAFWLLSFVFFFQQVGTSAVMVHIVPYLENLKIPTTIAATAVTGMTLSSLIGRLGFGMLGDFANKRYLIAVALALQTIGLFIFSIVVVDKIWLLILFLLTFGPGYGAPIPLRPALQADYFGTRSFGTVMGLMALISMVGGLVSPVVAGWIFDTTGSYQFAWRLFAFITLPAVPLMLLARPPKVPRF